MDLAWNSIPIFWNRFVAYNFYFWHPGVTVVPPTETPPLGPKDTAMLAMLETSVPDINLQIAASILSARNAPLPATPDPNSKRFWRVKVNADIDTDQDGSPDWAEFEIAARGTGMLVSGVTGDPFDADTNHDGKLDGLQLDADLDSTADASDPDIADNTATFPIGSVPRYALFPITNAMPPAGQPTPFQISDKGTVLYENGTWTANVWTALDTPPEASDNGYPSRAKAVGINDSNQIIGVADREITSTHEHDVNNDPSEVLPTICYWNAPNGARTFVSSGNGEAEKFAVPSLELFEHRLTPGPVLSNDGRFSAFIKPRTDWINASAHPGYWKLPEANQPATETSGDHRLKYTQGPNLRWGAGYSLKLDEINSYGALEDTMTPFERLILAPAALPAPPITAVNVFKPTDDLVLALPAADSASEGMALTKGKWDVSATYRNAIDIAADGTAIGRNRDDLIAPICINGKWMGIERTIARPGISNNWEDTTFSMLDTTPSGWILTKKSVTSLPDQSMVMVPFRVEGFYDTSRINVDDPDHPDGLEVPVDYTTGVGVDDFSIGSTDPGDTVGDHIWIMAPTEDGATFATFKAPLNLQTPLKFKSLTNNLKFGSSTEATLSLPSTQVAISAENSSSGLAIPVEMYFGALKSESLPIYTKAMKARIVNVTVYKIGKVSGNTISPDLVPSELAIRKHLDNLFKPQINVRFFVHLMPGQTDVSWSGLLDSAPKDKHSSDQATILGQIPAVPEDADIKVLLIGSNSPLDSGGTSLGLTNRLENTCWVLARSRVNYRKKQDVLDSIGHEIGHVLVGYGHPSEQPDEDHGKAPLSGTKHNLRLMTKGTTSSTESRILVKGEWDEAEKWLKARPNGDN